MPILEIVPPKIKVTVAPDKLAFALDAIKVIGDGAAALCQRYTLGRQETLDINLTAAREAFLKTGQWQSVLKLRDRLAGLSRIADAADAEYHAACKRYQDSLRQGDPVSGLSEMSQRQLVAANARRARNDVDEELTHLERQAAYDLRAAIKNAYARLQQDCRAEYTRRLDELVESINKDALIGLAVLENIVLSTPPTLPPQNFEGWGSEAWNPEVQGFDTLPPRIFVITRDSNSPAPPLTLEEKGREEQWGPVEIARPVGESPAQWGPSPETERVP